MADINVNVVLPDPISVDVTSPTQALATNVSVPGPQGPTGPRGAPTAINNIANEYIYISGADGIIVLNSGANTIFVSGNSGYFQDNINLISTNLRITGLTLDNKINSLSGWSASSIDLASTGSNLYTLLTNFSGNLDATYATDSQLYATGSALDNKINSLSGNLTVDYVTKINGQFDNRPTVNGTGILLSGEAAGLPTTIVYTTGDQIISGNKDFTNILLNGNPVLTGVDLTPYATIIDLATTGSTLDQKINIFSGTYQSFIDNLDATYATDIQLVNTGSTLDIKINNLSGYSASAINLAITGSNLYTLITNFSGNLDVDFASQIELNALSGYINSQDTSILNNLTSTGSTLDNKVNLLSGWSASAVNLTSTGVILINNLFNTGSALDTKINDLSGYVNAQDTTISNNLSTTGNTLDSKINSLSGAAVLKYGDQTIDGIKTFRDKVYIHDLYVTGEEFIANVTNNFIESPYILLNLTGGATDGGIFFVTGSGLTGINDLGPIIGFDHTDKFKFGISSRGSDLSTLNDIAAVQDITAYSGFVDGKYATIINLASTGSTLDTKINTLSGYSDNTFATIINLASTGSTLASDLANTGSTLNTKIDNLSGYVNSTGSNIVFTTGNQNITGIKIFTSPLIISGADLSGINTNGTQGFRLTSRALGLLGDSLQTVLVNEGYGGITTLGTDNNTTLRIQRGNNSSAVLPNNTSLGWYKPSPSNVSEVPDVRLWRDGSGILSLRSDNISRGTNFYITPSGMQFRVFNITGTNTGEFGLFGWQNNELAIGAQNSNSGILRPLIITGDSISYSGKRLTIAHTNAGLFFDAVTGPTIRGNHWGAGDAGFITYRNGLDMGRGGSKYLRVDSSSPTVIVGRGNTSYEVGIGFDGINSSLGSPDTFIMRDNAGVLSLRNPLTNLGNSPQQFRIYNITGTNTGEFGLVGWINSGLVIGPQQTNSGILRDLTLTGNNININASGAFNIFDNTNILGDLNVTGNISISGNQVLTGVDLSSYATTADLASTGSTLETKINDLSGSAVLLYGNQDITGNKTLSGSFYIGGQGHEQSAISIRGIDGISKILNLRDKNGENGFFVQGEIGTDLLIKMGDVDAAYNDAYLSFDQANALCKIENANLEVNGDGTSNSTVKIGTIEIQPYAINNAWFGDNTYYSGAFYRRNNGYAGAFYFQGPEGQFRFADYDVAGTTYTPEVKLKTHFDGRFGVGSGISTSSNDFTNSKFFVNSDGNVGINTITPSEKLEVNGDIKFGSPGSASATLYMYDGPNDAYNTIYWSDSEMQLINTADSSNITIQFSSNGNTLISNSSFLKLPTGKNDFLAMDSEVVHKTGNETISGIKAFISRPTVNGTGVLLSGEVDPLPTTIVYTTGNQIISGVKTFIGDHIISGDTTITGHLAATSKSFLINHPTQANKKLQYGSLESPYHGIRLTDKNKISADSVQVNLPDYISALVNEDKVNVQLTNINHDKVLFVKEVNVNQNNFVVGINRGWFDKNEYEFYWSFTAERKDIPKLTVEF